MPIKAHKTASLKDDALNSQKQHIISILCMQDGFSFVCYEKDRNKFMALEAFDLELHNRNIQDEAFDRHRCVALKVMTEESNLITKFQEENAYLIYAPNQATWLPLALFDEHEKENYIALNFEKPAGEVHFEINKHIEAVCVYTAYDIAIDCLKQLFPKAQIHPLQNVLADQFYQLVKNDNDEPTVFCFASTNKLYVQIFHEKKLMYDNCFSYQNKQDAAYYILNIYDKLKLNSETSPLYFTGAIVPENEIFMLLQKYIRQVDVVAENNVFSYSYLFNDINKSRFYHLFNTIPCALLEELGKADE